MLDGSPISRVAASIAWTASPRATPEARLKETVTEGNWRLGLTAREVDVWLEMGECAQGHLPLGRRTDVNICSVSGRCQKRGSTSITTWY